LRRKLKEKNTRKIFKSGSSYAVTIPMEIINELNWREKQRVIIKKRGQGVLIVDWGK